MGSPMPHHSKKQSEECEVQEDSDGEGGKRLSVHGGPTRLQAALNQQIQRIKVVEDTEGESVLIGDEESPLFMMTE